MFLSQTHTYLPKKQAYFLHSSPLVVDVHPSSNYLAFATRESETVLYNRKTGRSSILFKSNHGIIFLAFTQKYLVAVEKGSHEILVYSLKSQKLKKKITGHRSQVIKVAYCGQRGIFASISHDVCIIWDQATLSSIKWLKCSTTQYYDCGFSANGQSLFTSFNDGNVFNWNLDSFQHKQFALDIYPHKLASNANQFLLACNKHELMVSIYSKNVFSFQKIQPFWDGTIQNVGFIKDYVAIKTTEGLYLSQIRQQHRIVLKNVKMLKDPIENFIVGGYGCQLVLINKDLSEIKTMEIFSQAQNNRIPLTNPLLNEGSYCAGGYLTTEGCQLPNQFQSKKTYDYGSQAYKVQNMNSGTYGNSGFMFSEEKLKSFIRKNHIFPDKYRPSAYQYLLGLPINNHDFLTLERIKRHECTELLMEKYPLQNQRLFESMQNVMSLLANYSPIFAESDLIAPIVFPFVCIFGNDEFFCFEVLYKLFNNWLGFLFEEFPVANSKLLQNIYQILQIQDMVLLRHLKQIKVSFTKLVWSLLSSFFTTNLTREGFLSIVDTLFAHPDEPSLIVFILMGYLGYQRTTLLSMKSQQDLEAFLQTQHTVNTGQFMKKAFTLRQKYQKRLRFTFKAIDRKQKNYTKFDKYPTHAVKMYEGKRKLQYEQYKKVMDQQKYHEDMVSEMEKLMIRAKRQGEKSKIQAQSIALQNQNQLKNKININVPSKAARINRIKELMGQLKEMLANSADQQVVVRQFMPYLKECPQSQTDKQLDELQNKLMGLMTKLEPHKFSQPLKSQPISFGKNHITNHEQFKAAKNASLTNKLWDLDKIQLENQQEHFDNDFLRAIDN